MARKTARKGKVTELPKGYTAIGGFGQSWPNDNTKKGDAITGEVLEYDEFTVTRNGKKQSAETLKLEADNGTVYTVWRSAGNGVLFDQDYTEVVVWIRFDGLGPKKRGQNPAKLFTIAADLDE